MSTMYSRCHGSGAPKTSSIKFADLVRPGAPYPTFGWGAYFSCAVVVVGQAQYSGATRPPPHPAGNRVPNGISCPASVIGYELPWLFLGAGGPYDGPFAVMRHGTSWVALNANRRCAGVKGSLSRSKPRKSPVFVPCRSISGEILRSGRVITQCPTDEWRQLINER